MSNYPWTTRINTIQHVFIFLLGALAVGIAATYQPVVSIAAVCLLLLLAVSIHHPERISYAVLLSTAVSVDSLYQGGVFGIEILSLYKLGILALLVPCMLVYGIRLKFSYPVWALVIMLGITFGFSAWLPLLTTSIAVKAFVGLSLPFFFLLIQWKKDVAEKHIRLISLLPIISVVIGLGLQVLGLHSFTDVEFTGAVRVQGANIPPHLAMLSFLGIAVSLIEVKRKPKQAAFYYTVLALNFLILIATGTRGPILALLLMFAVYLFDIARQYLKGKVNYLLPLAGSFLVALGAVALQWNNLKKRSFERETDTGIDLSGRSEAWEYFLNRVHDYPWSGRGLGAVTVANDGTLFNGFVVPHNEYIRFYFDTGYIGCGLLMLSLLIVFALIYRSLAKSIKPYFVSLIAGFLIYSFSDNTLSTVQMIIPFCWYLNALYQTSTQTDFRKEK
ncbi:O-antigen ligase family protein [Paenibacillus sp. FSL M7-0802]|jgi:sulfite exporter TauE/SafE|uniref:O-antigen ligase family protein n=1 Tax=Paenibacillus TaxID=44249 RepID=UPI0003D2A39A|nr:MULTISPECIES: O-antigen ligase family protein [Paenibacillus]AHC18796.1 polysaccharide polymerase [Paenibacillus polymyxa CR1]APQ58371.1 polysaccharide polymerase [Paenibacillus polymyxa]ODB56734.1 polysaccharide polymerase [Paenibacillus polymyxa]SFR01857.1 O-antigen ligase [Paenibacillus sp. cl130]